MRLKECMSRERVYHLYLLKLRQTLKGYNSFIFQVLRIKVNDLKREFQPLQDYGINFIYLN